MPVSPMQCARLGLVCSMLVAPVALQAQQAQPPASPDPSNTRGLFLNVRSGGSGMAYQDDRDGTGLGGGARLGYGFSDRLTVYLGAEAGSISDGKGFQGLPEGDSYGLLFLEIGARYHFRRDARLMPFLEAGGSVVGLWFDNSNNQEVFHAGPAATGGGGLLYFMSPRVALEGTALFTAGRLTDREIAGVRDESRIGMSGVRLQLGLTFYPFR